MLNEGSILENIDIYRLADYLSVNVKTVYNWVESNLIPHKKHGNVLIFNKHDIDEWIEGSRKKVFKEDLFGSANGKTA